VVKGSLVWVSLEPARGAEVPKTRPCIIVSRTEANDVSSTVTIVPLSSVTGRAADRLVQPLLSAKDTRLSKDSRALCDQVRTIDKGRIRDTVGVLSPELLGRIDRGLILHSGTRGLCHAVGGRKWDSPVQTKSKIFSDPNFLPPGCYSQLCSWSSRNLRAVSKERTQSAKWYRVTPKAVIDPVCQLMQGNFRALG
jgi:mRNA interferase MazF